MQNTIGKHKPMTYMVGVDSGTCIERRTVGVSRSSRQRSRTKRFNVQYEGKTVLDPVRINKDIINISGATMSVRSMSAGIKRVLVLVDEFYLKPAGAWKRYRRRAQGQGVFSVHLRELDRVDLASQSCEISISDSDFAIQIGTFGCCTRCFSC